MNKEVPKKKEVIDDMECACTDKIPPPPPPPYGDQLSRSVTVRGRKGTYELRLSVAYRGQLGDGPYSPWLYEITLSSPYETEHKYFTIDPSYPNDPRPEIREDSTTFIIGHSKRRVAYESFHFILERAFSFEPAYHAMVNEAYSYDRESDEVVIVPTSGLDEYKNEVEQTKRYRTAWAAYEKELRTNKDASFHFTNR